jgi:fibronectin type 3 domain-containing protein
VASPLRVSVFFPASPERDVAGYNIFRSTDADLPKESWTKVNRELLQRTTYQDEAVKSGQKYFYYVVAVDASGNVSPPSEVHSDTVP